MDKTNGVTGSGKTGIFVGKTASIHAPVTAENTAKAVGSGSLDVFATPMMIALMERASCECLSNILEPDQTSVGTDVCIKHTAASPIGIEVTATATIIGIDERKIEFEVTATDTKGEIGCGTHERIIVNTERFMTKIG